jgi:hypothetical protein
MSGYIRANSAWRTLQKGFLYANGAWRSVQNGFLYANGAWRQFFSSGLVPVIAAQVTIVTEKVLQQWISEHKMKNSKAQYDFIVEQFEKKQKEFFFIQDQLASYMDRNQNVLSSSYLTRLDRLQSEFDLVKTVYSELAKQKEQASIQLSKDTPTFSVLDPVKIPMGKTGPSKIKFISIGAFLGVVFSLVWKFGEIIIKNLGKKIKS